MINLWNSFLVCLVLLCTGFNTEAVAADDELLFKSRVTGHTDTLWRDFAADVADNTDSRLQLSTAEPAGQFQFEEAENGLSRRRYIANSVQPCAVGHSVWADVIAFDQRRYSSAPSPYLLSDFFNDDAFPGKRAVKKSARGIFEWILINQGYAPDQIYQVLSMESSWKKISESLIAMQKNIIWVDTDEQALELLNNGLVVFAAVSSHSLARSVFENVARDYPATNQYGVIWHGAIAHMNFLAVPKTENAERGLEVLRVATEPMRNLKASTEVGYVPVHIDQSRLIKDLYRQVLPVAEHLDNVLWGNSLWWREQGELLQNRFHQFLGELSYDEKISSYDQPELKESESL